MSNITLPNITGQISSPKDSDKIIAATMYITVSFVGIFIHVIVFLGFLKMHDYKLAKLPPFYILASNLYLADIVKSLLYMFYASPSILTGHVIIADWIADLEGVDYSCIVLSTFMLSVNRAITIENNRLVDVLFTPRLCVVYAIGCWLTGVLITILDRVAFDCRHVLDVNGFHFGTKCVYHAASANITSIVIYVGIYGLTIFYLRALYVLHKNRLKIQTNDMDQRARQLQIRLFLQALFVWLGLICNTICKYTSYRLSIVSHLLTIKSIACRGSNP